MADETGIKVIGLKELNRALTQIGVPRSEMNAAAKQSAESVLIEAKALVPVRTGKLRNSIKLTATTKGISIRAGNEGKVPYANPIHWGWFRRHIKPQPFLTKALGYTRQEIFDNYYKQMDTLIQSKRSGSQVK
jgi:HK97 gp10 family phage protein